jgi:hypothetical protein
MDREDWIPKTADQLRIQNNPKASDYSLFGYEGGATSRVMNRGEHAPVNKNTVDTYYEMGPERYFTTVGVQKGETTRAIQNDKYTHRSETSTSYVGNVNGENAEYYADGEYMPSHRNELGETPIPGAYKPRQHGNYVDDYGGIPKVYTNNRTLNENNEHTYFGSIKQSVKSIITPIMDVLRPTKKDNTIGNIRPYQGAGSKVPVSYTFNSGDRLKPTIRETIKEQNTVFVNGVSRIGHTVPFENTNLEKGQQRITTHSDYVGNSAFKQGGVRQIDADLNQRDSGLKSGVLSGYTTAGGRMNIMDNSINMRQKTNSINQADNTRQLVGNYPTRTVGVEESSQMTRKGNNLNMDINNARNNPDILEGLKGNPFLLNHVNALQ